MAKETEIAWTDSTFNPWWGCQKVGPGCDNCYAEKLDKRTGGDHWGASAERRRTSIKNWNEPIRWNKKADAFFAAHGRRQRIFCASMADVFDNEIPVQWRIDLFTLIKDTPNLDWLILTKRIGNVMSMCSGDSLMSDMLCERVWLGATIVNQVEADRDIPKLLATPAHKRFLSMEPLLASVNIIPYIGGRAIQCGCGFRQDEIGLVGATQAKEGCIYCYKKTVTWPTIDWVIVGGETGPGARPMHPDWVRSLRDQCHATKVPFLFKQWGEWAPHRTIAGGDEGGDVRRGHVRYIQGDDREPDGHFRKGDAAVARIGKKASGRLLDAVLHHNFPA